MPDFLANPFWRKSEGVSFCSAVATTHTRTPAPRKAANIFTLSLFDVKKKHAGFKEPEHSLRASGFPPNSSCSRAHILLH